MLHVRLWFPQCISHHREDAQGNYAQMLKNNQDFSLADCHPSRFFICCHSKKTENLHSTSELRYRRYMMGLYNLPLKGAVQSASRTVSNLDASVLLPQCVDFAVLKEAKGQYAKQLRKILSPLIFSA